MTDRRAYNILPIILSFILFLTAPLETNLRIYWTDLHQILGLVDIRVGGGHDQPDLPFVIAQGTLLW